MPRTHLSGQRTDVRSAAKVASHFRRSSIGDACSYTFITGKTHQEPAEVLIRNSHRISNINQSVSINVKATLHAFSGPLAFSHTEI